MLEDYGILAPLPENEAPAMTLSSLRETALRCVFKDSDEGPRG